MKVVLKKAVVKLGVPGDVVDVARGYAFNFLIPQGIALFADAENLKAFEAKKAEFLAEHNKAKTIAEEVKYAIEGKAILMERQVNDSGNFYAAISTLEIADLLNSQFKQDGFEFNKNQISISNKIKHYGIYDVIVMLYNGVVAKMNVSIEASRALAEEAWNKKTQPKS